MKLRTLMRTVQCTVTRHGTAAALVASTVLTACAADPAVNATPSDNGQNQAAFATTNAALAVGSVSPDKNQAGFPTWYADINNVALEPCIDPLDPHCVVLPNAGIYDISKPQIFPTNYPDEFFYSIVDSAPIATAACGNVGSVLMRFAVEGAFIGGVPKQGDQMSFGRIRFSGDGLCPLHDYTITHPYGKIDLTTDDRGRLRPKNPAVTSDVGCLPTAAAPCDFTLALNATHFQQGFLRWDPAFAPYADTGYLSGDAATLHRITGGIGGVNAVDVTEVDGTPLYHTDLFTVAGKIASTLKPSTDIVDVGSVVAGTPQTRTFTLTNGGPADETVSGLTVFPADNGWTVTSDCTGPVTPAGSCVVTATFNGTTLGDAHATLSIGTTTSTGLVNVTLAANVVAAGTAPKLTALTVDKTTSAAFGRVIIGGSATQLLTLRNEGPGDLSLTSLAVTDAVAGSGDAAKFAQTNNCPVAGVLKSGSTCFITQKFSPIDHKVYAANIAVAGTWDTTPASLTMGLSGRGGIAHSSQNVDGLGADGFPLWYQDDGSLANPTLAGTRVSQCLDVNNPLCVVLPDAGYDPALPLSFPTNYPGESFYFIADAAAMTVNDCGTGKATLRFAIEQSFATGKPIAGDQMTFARQRLTVTGGLCPNTTYTLNHPYGSTKFFVDASGGIKANQGVVDVGCVPTAGKPCNFDIAVETAVSDQYLRWDPTVAPAAPAGYLGDPAVAHAVVGSPVGYNQVALVNDASGVTAASVNQFLVAGKLAAPSIASSATSIDFGVVAPTAPGNTSTRVLTITNPGTSATTFASFTLTGDKVFTIASQTCGLTLGASANCTVTLVMTGSGGNAPHAGKLAVVSDAGNVNVALSGAVGTTAVLVATPLSLAFGNQTINTTSAAKTIAVSNGGPNALLYALKLTLPTPGKTTVAGRFSVTVPVGCSASMYGTIGCAISVTFRPTTAGNFTQNVTLTSDKGGSKIVTLTGTGQAIPTATLTTATLTMKAGAKGIATFTNTGTIAVQMGNPVFAITGTNADRFTVTANTCPGVGGSVLVASACKLTITYTRPAGLAATLVHTASLTVNSTAGAKTIALRGTN